MGEDTGHPATNPHPSDRGSVSLECQLSVSGWSPTWTSGRNRVRQRGCGSHRLHVGDLRDRSRTGRRAGGNRNDSRNCTKSWNTWLSQNESALSADLGPQRQPWQMKCGHRHFNSELTDAKLKMMAFPLCGSVHLDCHLCLAQWAQRHGRKCFHFF